MYWRIRPTLRATWRQYAGYAEGDALAACTLSATLLRFAAYAFAAVAVVTRNRAGRAAARAGGFAYAARPSAGPGAGSRRVAGARRARCGVPAMIAFIDAAKMWGYLRGLGRRPHPRQGSRPRRRAALPTRMARRGLVREPQLVELGEPAVQRDERVVAAEQRLARQALADLALDLGRQVLRAPSRTAR